VNLFHDAKAFSLLTKKRIQENRRKVPKNIVKKKIKLT
jgi:hypothetical protein